MDEKQATLFLFNIAKEVKSSFEHPIILLTKKDYADCIFNSMVDMQTALLQNAATERVIEIITIAHMNWLQAVRDVEEFKEAVSHHVPLEVILEAIHYTMECAENRYKYFRQYIDKLLSTMTAEERKLMQSDFDITSDMKNALCTALEDKQKCISYLSDKTEYIVKVAYEVEELMNWLDKLNDNLALQFSKVVGLKYPELLTNLMKTMHDIGEEVLGSYDPETKNLLEEMKNKRKVIGSRIRFSVTDELEIRKIQAKIQNLKYRIERLKKEDSVAVTALQHKTTYLEDRLQSLENLKGAFHEYNNNNCIGDVGSEECLKCVNIHIFEHLLSAKDRCRLVEQLLNLWNIAVRGGTPEEKSIISILSVADLKEVYSDDMGRFTIDRHGRKLYKVDNSGVFYQRDNNNELVKVNDDDEHVYFYDYCGRYYMSEYKERVYKAHPVASEYILDEGEMVKIKEVHKHTEYHFDNLGRYYIDKNNKRIYCERDSIHTYEQDGLGNLVLIISKDWTYKSCPVEPIVLEENRYLQRSVGIALRKCLADIVLHQPADPIKYLASSLEKFRYNMDISQQGFKDEELLRAEREFYMHTHELQGQGSPAPSNMSREYESTTYSASTTIL